MKMGVIISLWIVIHVYVHCKFRSLFKINSVTIVSVVEHVLQKTKCLQNICFNIQQKRFCLGNGFTGKAETVSLGKKIIDPQTKNSSTQ